MDGVGIGEIFYLINMGRVGVRLVLKAEKFQRMVERYY
jgi:hypothetical protein